MGLYILYFIELIFLVGLFALVIGVAYKIVTYPQKEVHYINEYGNPRTKLVDDTDYHYKPEELYEPPAHWSSWKANIPEQHNIVINEYGDDHWPHTEANA